MPDETQAEETEFELPEGISFEEALKRLETIVRTLEDDGYELEEALRAHAEGMALAKFCMTRLDTAELKIQNVTLE